MRTICVCMFVALCCAGCSTPSAKAPAGKAVAPSPQTRPAQMAPAPMASRIPGQAVRFKHAVITITPAKASVGPVSMTGAGLGIVNGVMADGHVCAVWWDYVGTNEAGDGYDFVILPGWRGGELSVRTKPGAGTQRICQHVAYAGTAITVYEDDAMKITMQPPR